uniref:Collagen type IV alpha-3-binding protein n=2 Tax=Wuchereria bancrofti TaxID=6293 RepID=A0AAF5Q023_WUCBA
MAAVRQHGKSLNNVNVEDEDNTLLKVYGTMYKWTNFVYGWQKRYFELENGILMYYKSESEKQYGSRGAIALHIAHLVESDIDFNRFDVLTNDACWYLRTQNPKSRNLWLRALRYQMFGSTNKLKNRCSTDDVTRSANYEQSSLSLELMSKMEQLERFNDMIGRQATRLENLIRVIQDNRGNTYATSLLDESIALNAVTIAVLQNINTCVHLLAKQTKANHKQCSDENCHTAHMDIANNCSRSIMLNQTCELNNVSSDDDDEQEWHDADDCIPANKSNVEGRSFAGKETVRIPGSESLIERERASENYPDIAESPPKDVTLPASNEFAIEINRIAMEQLKYARSGIYDDVWQLFMEEDEMKMYKRELEVNGIVCDPLKAVHLVQGVSAREYIHYFFEPRYKHEWDETLVRTRVVDRISMDTVIIHQLHKRIWPSAQRESLFWSNVRYLPEQKSPKALDLYMVCNHDCNLPSVPLEHNSNVRVGLTVAMLCETVVKDGHEKPVDKLNRNDIQCQVCYCAQVNPGGWVPASALRIIYKREYPKFLHGFTKYVLSKIKTQPLIV